MPVTERLNHHEIAALGDALYESRLRYVVDTEANLGKLLSIDVDSGEYEIGDDDEDAHEVAMLEHLLARRPAARIYTLRIGYPVADAVGGGLRPLPREQRGYGDRAREGQIA